jgi:uncharacterized protein DUF2130
LEVGFKLEVAYRDLIVIPDVALQPVAIELEQIYNYLTGTKFRQRVEAFVEKFSDMREDLDKEREFMERQCARRETQILFVMTRLLAWSAICKRSPTRRFRRHQA